MPGCNSEETEIKNKKRKQEVREKQAPQVYYRTYISEDFSKSFEDLLIIDRHPSANRSNNSYPSLSSSSVKDLSVNKDDIDAPNNNQDNAMKNLSSSVSLKVIELEDFLESEEQNLIGGK
ncbi:8681_t:CDS:2, partial [Racocetra fulgida]